MIVSQGNIATSCPVMLLLESFHCIIEAENFSSDDVLITQWIMSVTQQTKESIKTL